MIEMNEMKKLFPLKYEDAVEAFVLLNVNSAWNKHKEHSSPVITESIISDEALFCILSNYEWKRKHNQEGSDLEEKLALYVSPRALYYLNALVNYWGNIGHTNIPFTAYNGINSSNTDNVLARAASETIRIPSLGR